VAEQSFTTSKADNVTFNINNSILEIGGDIIFLDLFVTLYFDGIPVFLLFNIEQKKYTKKRTYV
jgi:hypothetical protein